MREMKRRLDRLDGASGVVVAVVDREDDIIVAAEVHGEVIRKRSDDVTGDEFLASLETLEAAHGDVPVRIERRHWEI